MCGIIPLILPAALRLRKKIEKTSSCREKGIDKSKIGAIIPMFDAGVAHLVERHLAKVEVASSSLVTRSNKKTDAIWRLSFLCFAECIFCRVFFYSCPVSLESAKKS